MINLKELKIRAVGANLSEYDAFIFQECANPETVLNLVEALEIIISKALAVIEDNDLQYEDYNGTIEALEKSIEAIRKLVEI